MSRFKFSRYFHLLYWNSLSASDKPWWNTAQVSWLWTCSPLGVACWAVYAWSRNVVVSCSWTFAGCSTIFVRCRRMVNWMYFCWNDIWLRSFPWTLRYWSAFQDLSATWNAYLGHMACRGEFAAVQPWVPTVAASIDNGLCSGGLSVRYWFARENTTLRPRSAH